MAKWSRDIRKWTQVQKLTVEEVKRQFVFFLYSNIVKRTPVDTGRARANWHVSKGHVDKSIVDETITEPKGIDSIPDGSGDEDFYISNNLPYITTLEYGGFPNPVKKGSWDKKTKTFVKKSENGFSKQAPNGMVGVTVAEVDGILQKALTVARGKAR